MLFQGYSRKVFLWQFQIFIPLVCKNCGSVSSVSFEAPREETVYELTKEKFGITDSPKYGPDFVIGIGPEPHESVEFWTYHVKIQDGYLEMPPYPANDAAHKVQQGAVIEWRRV